MFEIEQTKELIEYRNGISSTPNICQISFLYLKQLKKEDQKIISKEIKMSRVYINGVHDFSYDGKNLSFSLTDTHEVKTGEVRKTVSFHCVSELNVIEDICKYIIKEINTIKSMSKDKKKKQ